MTDATIISCFIVGLTYGGEAKVRMQKYKKQKGQLLAIEENDTPDAPYGLKRVRLSEMPKLGGAFNETVVAFTFEQGLAKLTDVVGAALERKRAEVERPRRGTQVTRDAEGAMSERRPGLRQLAAAAKPGECLFCGEPAKPRKEGDPGRPTQLAKPGFYLTCGDDVCDAAYNASWKRDQYRDKTSAYRRRQLANWRRRRESMRCEVNP